MESEKKKIKDSDIAIKENQNKLITEDSKKMDKMLTLKKIVVFMINKIKVILTRNFSEKKESTQEQNKWWANAIEIFQTYKSFFLNIYSL
jgi:hypothetical protein